MRIALSRLARLASWGADWDRFVEIILEPPTTRVDHGNGKAQKCCEHWGLDSALLNAAVPLEWLTVGPASKQVSRFVCNVILHWRDRLALAWLRIEIQSFLLLPRTL